MLNYRLKKSFIFFISLFVSVSFFSQTEQRKIPEKKLSKASIMAGAFIDVNVPPYPASSYTAEQLVKDVLISGGTTCFTPDVSNVTVSPNHAATNTNRFWGYFNRGTTNFPFEEGIVLVTGQARKAGNIAYSSVSDLVTFGGTDADLVAATNPGQPLNDAVVLEFDFVANSNKIKFNYIFASEEFTQSFACGPYSDAFALLLKKASDPAYTNLAVLPGGAGPVRVTNILPSAYSCGPLNAQYFGVQNTANTVTNFNGWTIPLTAEANVTPGETYHLKMVLADARDFFSDTAVFLEGGSFDLSIKIADGNGVDLPSTIDLCSNSTQTLAAQVAPTPGMTYQWFRNNNPIPGATGTTYVATEGGVYDIRIFSPGGQCPGGASITINGVASPVVQNSSITKCYANGNIIFDLTSAESDINAQPGMVFKYYLNQADALVGNGNNIATPTTFSSPGAQTIYVNVSNGICSTVAELELIKAPQIIANILPPPQITCADMQVTLNAGTSVFPSGATFNWVASAGGNIVSGGNTLAPVVDAVGTYTLTISNTLGSGEICSGTSSVNVTENKTKPTIIVAASKARICQGESVVLTATGGVSYVWNIISGNGGTQTVSPVATTTYTVSGFGTNGCEAAVPATITIEVVPAITSTLQGGQICIGDKITLDAGTGPNYTYLWSNGATTRTITIDTPGAYTVTINNGVCSADFTAQVIQAVVPEVIKVDYNNGTMTVTASNPSNGVMEYSVDGGVTWQSSNVFTNVLKNTVIPIRVRVRGTSCVGFLDYFTFEVRNIITPNGDGINDTIDFEGISNYKDFKATIFDRYGKEIFKSEKGKTKWNGLYLGTNLPTASYWYRISYEDPASKKVILKTGWILLKNRE